MNNRLHKLDLQSPRDAALCLSMVSGIGPKTYTRLLEEFGSPGDVLEAEPSQLLSIPGIGQKLAGEIAGAKEQIDIRPQLDLCEANGIQIIDRDHDFYPPPLQEIHDPPNILFTKGKFRSADSIAIAIVGTRHATHYGKTIAERLARGLAMSGFTIVSGMARGIDAAAHRGALQSGGRTIAVLGSGLLNVYPPEHKDLSDEIASQGVLVSEMLPNQSPRSGAFPQRNRIVTGLSLGLIVVEAAERSGALISARLAMEQGREVFAVPGPVNSRMSKGCHGLIKDGAKLVESIDDVLEELGPLSTPAKVGDLQTVRHPAELKLTEQETSILQAIGSQPSEIDQIIEQTEIPAARVLATVSVLEIRRLIKRLPGNKLVRV